MRIDDIITPESVCPICAHTGTLTVEDIEESVIIGSTVVMVSIHAAVCCFCGEHIYDTEAQAKLDAATKALRAGRLDAFVHTGEVYHA